MAESESWRAVGKRIRLLRKGNELTLKQLSLGCGMSINALSLVERGEVAPTIATLCKIAHALGVPVGHFFQDICPSEVVIHRAGERDACEVSRQALSALTADLEPGESCIPIGFACLTVLCVSGTLEYRVYENGYRVNPGDSLTFNANAPHVWKNLGQETGVAVMILPPCDEPDERKGD